MALSPAVCLLHFLLFYLHAKKTVFWWSESMEMIWKLWQKRRPEWACFWSKLIRTKLNCCTPLDRVMFDVCALLKSLSSSWAVWNVVVPTRCLLGNNDGRLLKLLWEFLYVWYASCVELLLLLRDLLEVFYLGSFTLNEWKCHCVNVAYSDKSQCKHTDMWGFFFHWKKLSNHHHSLYNSHTLKSQCDSQLLTKKRLKPSQWMQLLHI